MLYASMTDREQRERDGDVSPDHTPRVLLLAVGCTTGQKCPENGKKDCVRMSLYIVLLANPA